MQFYSRNATKFFFFFINKTKQPQQQQVFLFILFILFHKTYIVKTYIANNMLYLSFTLLAVFSALLILICNGNQLYECPDSKQGRCGRCTSVNDPHITTFDGIYYDQHTDYCFKYVTECPFGAANPVPFEICGCHYDCGFSKNRCPNNIRCIGDLSLKFYDIYNGYSTTFEITIDYQNPGNPAQDTLNIGALTSGNSYVYDVAGNLFIYIQIGNVHHFAVYGSEYYAYISYSPGDLEIYLSHEYFSRSACGLCGYFDQDDGSNDFIDNNGIIVVNPDDISRPVDEKVNDQINDFANSYLCDISTSCPVTDEQKRCFELILELGCCETLWKRYIDENQWSNQIITPDEFFQNWLIGCATDVCALTNNAITDECDFRSGAFDFAKQAAVNTAFKRYFS